jgi:hypothetical protein
MQFPVRKQYLSQFTGTAALGNQITFNLTRDFFLSSLILNIPITVAGTFGTAASWSTMGLFDLITRVQLQIADGASNRNQTDATGGALLRRAARLLSGLDSTTAANVGGSLAALGFALNRLETVGTGDSAGQYLLRIPMLFHHPEISDPISNIFMLPLPRYNTNPNLVVTFGQKSDAILSGAAGATIVIGNSTFPTPWLTIMKRQVDVLSFPTIDTEFREISTTYASTGPNQLQNLDTPGSYSAIDFYMTNSGGVGADITGGQTQQLQILSQVLQQFTMADLKAIEQYTMGNDNYMLNAAAASPAALFTDMFPGFYHMDFLHDEYGMEVGELGSLLNANVLAGSGTQVQVLQNLTSTGQISYAVERFFGDLSPFTFSLNTAAG